MKQRLVQAAVQLLGALRRACLVAPVIASVLVAALCADLPSSGAEEPDELAGSEAPTETDPVEPDEESPELADEVEADTGLALGPTVDLGVAQLVLADGELAGFGSRVPRPSGV